MTEYLDPSLLPASAKGRLNAYDSVEHVLGTMSARLFIQERARRREAGDPQ